MDLTEDGAITQLDERIRDVLSGSGRLFVDVSSLRDQDDLFEAGLSSHANIAVLLALEVEFTRIRTAAAASSTQRWNCSHTTSE